MLRSDQATLERYSSSSGPVRLLPLAVALPADVEDVIQLVRWAEAEGLSLIPRGAGTGMPGGNVGPGVVVDLSRLDQIGELRLEGGSATVVVGAGAVAAKVEDLARRAGFFLPPLPSSADRCTLGGMIANNAAGARTFRHGAVRDWVVELEVVGSGGEVHPLLAGEAAGWTKPLHEALHARLGCAPAGWPRVRKNASGYALDRFLPGGDALQLLVGSEGTLGVVTRARVRLETRPRSSALVLLGLRRLHDLPTVARAAQDAGATACEMLGGRILEMAALEQDPRVGRLAAGAAALVLLELAGTEDELDESLVRARRLASELGSATVETVDEHVMEELWELRHRASPTIARAAARGLRSTQFIEDSVVPVERLPNYLEGLGVLLQEADTDAVIFGHAGDGNLHVNPLVDVGRTDWRARVRGILEGTAALVASLGGTLTAEHGDGRVRAPLLDRVWQKPLVNAFREVKETLDPAGIFNPGVIVPLPGQDPLDGLWQGAA